MDKKVKREKVSFSSCYSFKYVNILCRWYFLFFWNRFIFIRITNWIWKMWRCWGKFIAFFIRFFHLLCVRFIVPIVKDQMCDRLHIFRFKVNNKWKEICVKDIISCLSLKRRRIDGAHIVCLWHKRGREKVRPIKTIFDVAIKLRFYGLFSFFNPF